MPSDCIAGKFIQACSESSNIEFELQFPGRCATLGRTDEIEEAHDDRFTVEGDKTFDPLTTTDG